VKKRGCFVLSVLLLLCLLVQPIGAFSDVRPGSWYTQVVTEMTDAGWLAGYPDQTFRPDQTITYAEFAAIVAQRAGLSQAEAQVDHWGAGLAEAVRGQGWLDWDELPPTGANYDLPIPRQVAVKLVMKAFYPGARGDYNTESAKMKDFSQLDGRYYEAVLAAYAVGVVTGDDTGCFHPKDGLSRAEACVLIQKAGENAAVPAVDTAQPAEQQTQAVTTVQGGVSQNGWLQVKGTQLCNQAGEPVVLRGMSSHGMQWYSQYAASSAIRSTAAWGANLFRVAMYTGEGGYLSDPSVKNKVIAAVDAAIQNDMYVIVDWHILSDGNPMSHVSEAKAFFAEMAKRYQNEPAVLYEICNEPNGNVSWSQDIKPYAQQVIAAIRAQSPNAVVLVGSGTWSQDIHLAANDPLTCDNVMYTLHFYAGTHGSELRDRIDAARKKGLAIFVSEWGTSRADGSGGVFLKESKVWLDFLEARGISWANWSLCDKNETSAALKPGTSPNGPWTSNDLSESGKFVFSRFRG
jgi:aryl-phospho-beta-D-glucosidase BglC (GH1 family)